jgi:hypothetical protein
MNMWDSDEKRNGSPCWVIEKFWLKPPAGIGEVLFIIVGIWVPLEVQVLAVLLSREVGRIPPELK